MSVDPLTAAELAAIKARDATMVEDRDGQLTPRHDRRLLLAEVERLRAQLAAVEGWIAEESTHGPVATYYTLRARAALDGR